LYTTSSTPPAEFQSSFLGASLLSKGKQSAMRLMSVLLIESMLEQVREVKVVILWEKVRKPFVGITGWLERLSDVSFNGKCDIWMRSLLWSP